MKMKIVVETCIFLQTSKVWITGRSLPNLDPPIPIFIEEYNINPTVFGNVFQLKTGGYKFYSKENPGGEVIGSNLPLKRPVIKVYIMVSTLHH
jgi:hypothetical protein